MRLCEAGSYSSLSETSRRRSREATRVVEEEEQSGRRRGSAPPRAANARSVPPPPDPRSSAQDMRTPLPDPSAAPPGASSCVRLCHRRRLACAAPPPHVDLQERRDARLQGGGVVSPRYRRDLPPSCLDYITQYVFYFLHSTIAYSNFLRFTNNYGSRHHTMA